MRQTSGVSNHISTNTKSSLKSSNVTENNFNSNKKMMENIDDNCNVTNVNNDNNLV